MKAYDICVITAANDFQADGYRQQLEWRKGQKLLPTETEFFVYSDPEGKRIGSGGSTIYVLGKLIEDYGYDFAHLDDFFRGKRILILHSGGDSRRLPSYSAVGKIFTPLPTEKFIALFDILLDNFMQLPYLEQGQVIVTSGDVLLSFDSDYVSFSDTGVTGIAYPDSPEIASNHGVYIVLSNHSEGNLRKVIDFLQKPDSDEMESANALDHANRAFVDTGIMNFAFDAIEMLIKAATSSDYPTLFEQTKNAEVKIDLYQEITFALLGKIDSFTGSQELRKIPFSVNLLPYCDFFHVGKSKEFLRNFHTITHASFLYDFCNFVNSNIKDHPELRNGYVYNTIIDTDAIAATSPFFIECCYIGGKIELGGENILTGIPPNSGDIILPKGICMTVIPVLGKKDSYGWVAIIYGIDDSFKYAVDEDECSFLNTNLSDWLSKYEISPSNLWGENEKQELWNARLFPASKEPATSIEIALNLQKGIKLEQWENTERLSLKEILQIVDYKKLLENKSQLVRKSKLRNINNILTPDSDISSEEILSWCIEPEDLLQLNEYIWSMVEKSDNLLFQARLYKLLSNIARKKLDW